MAFSSDSSPSAINVPALPPQQPLPPLPPPPPPPPPPHCFPPSRHHLAPSLAFPRSSHVINILPDRYQRTHGLSHFQQYSSPGSFAASTPPPKPKAARRKPADLASAAGAATTPPCTECGKRFSSWKALFGHMRCHPERQWRGINPPPHLRRPPPPQDQQYYFTAEEHEVAASLLLLSRSPPGGATTQSLSAADERGSIWQPTCGEGGRHECDVVCSRAFSSSGQALQGGHKRCHLEMDCQELVGPGPPSVAGPSSRRSYIFDLNLPPPPESSDNNNNNNNNNNNPADILDLKLGI